MPVPLVVTEEHSDPVATSEDHGEQQHDDYEESFQNEQGVLITTNSHDASTSLPVETRSVVVNEHAGLLPRVEHIDPASLEPTSEGVPLQPFPMTAADGSVAAAEPLTFGNNSADRLGE
ncbi:hypothetical protein V6N13_114730 [Hibiscus sabdariffa]